MGLVLAAPLSDSHPVAASSVVLGSVLPDLDALSRLAGKRAFLLAHQTASHSLPFALALGATWAVALTVLGLPGALTGVALALSMLLHSLLDLTNTYGVTPMWPFNRRRRSLEWVFFIDAVVVVLTVVALAAVTIAFYHGRLPGWGISAVWFGAVMLYFATKRWLRRRAQRLGPVDAVSYVPSALWPWRFYGHAPGNGVVRMFTLNAVNGRRHDAVTVPIHDARYRDAVSHLPEFVRMAQLSPAYHVVEARARGELVDITCRDLRTRNFGGHFGELRVTLNAAGEATGAELNV